MSEENFSGYFSGPIPDYAAGLVGSGQVDASQITSSFGKAHDAIKLVNDFDSSLLKNIAYIFNFSKSGAYGVYIPALDKAIKTKELEKILRQKGYEVEVDNGQLVAYSPDGTIKSEQINQEIKQHYGELEDQGGHVISLNVKRILEDAKDDAQNIYPLVEEVWSEEETMEYMAVLHLGETIVHEATHAQGHMDEGEPTNQQNRFVSWLWPKLKAEHKNLMISKGLEDQYQELPDLNQTRHASTKALKKYAQYFPVNFENGNAGSDLSGRHGFSDQGWGLLVHQNSTAPIETRLSRDYMFPLPEGVDQRNQSIEEQLQLFNKEHAYKDKTASYEMLLNEKRDNEEAYMSHEELLENNRPKPLLLPIKKASGLVKEATLFGWYNNLEISDGSTIPGLSDRVMAWDDRDESFSEEESWIRSQPRYNPKGYENGFWYRWMDLRQRPQTWVDKTYNNPQVSPALRFASLDITPSVCKVIEKAKARVEEGIINVTRFVVSEDLLEKATSIVGDINNTIYTIGKINGEFCYALWLYNEKVDQESIDDIELMFNKKDLSPEEILAVLDTFRPDFYRLVNDVLSAVRKISEDKLFIVGSSAQKLLKGEEIRELDLISKDQETTFRIGYAIAELLSVPTYNLNHDKQKLSFNHYNLRINFITDTDNPIINHLMKSKGLDDSDCLLKEVCNRAFTNSMLCYDIQEGKFSNLLNVDYDELETFFDAEIVLKHNPILIFTVLECELQNSLGLSNINISDSLKNLIVEKGNKFLEKKDSKIIENYRDRLDIYGIHNAQSVCEHYNIGD